MIHYIESVYKTNHVCAAGDELNRCSHCEMPLDDCTCDWLNAKFPQDLAGRRALKKFPRDLTGRDFFQNIVKKLAI